MSKKVILFKNIEIDISKVSEIGKIIRMENEKPMFCFTVGFSDGTFKNIYLHYNDSNETSIKKKIENLHSRISSFIENKSSFPSDSWRMGM
ncbi:MAG: hypothetical protein P9L89_05140 [Candidatus Celaenobacter polaris]|nr:hypothetical protein [Candidatus Celaenobacter polaris]